jgi:hypothetical protein
VSGEKSLILDANILIRATLGIRVPGLLEKMSPLVRFFTPEICVADAYKYLPPLLQKQGIDEQTSIASLDAVVRTVNVLDEMDHLNGESMKDGSLHLTELPPHSASHSPEYASPRPRIPQDVRGVGGRGSVGQARYEQPLAG